MGIQFFPTDHNQSVVPYKSDFMQVNNVPSKLQIMMEVSCYDCHSNNTNYPWYSRVQPVAWFLENHIKKGKADLNFNEWGDYSDRRKNSKLRSIISQIEDDEMPLSSYTITHKNAGLSKTEKALLIKYMKELKDSLK